MLFKSNLREEDISNTICAYLKSSKKLRSLKLDLESLDSIFDGGSSLLIEKEEDIFVQTYLIKMVDFFKKFNINYIIKGTKPRSNNEIVGNYLLDLMIFLNKIYFNNSPENTYIVGYAYADPLHLDKRLWMMRFD